MSARSHLRSELTGPRVPAPGISQFKGIYRFTRLKDRHVAISARWFVTPSTTVSSARAPITKNLPERFETLLEHGGSACLLQDEWGGGESCVTSASRVFWAQLTMKFH